MADSERSTGPLNSGQWGINDSLATLAKTGYELLVATTKDDVQTSAIIACMNVGTTLTMCQKTREMVQKKLESPDKKPIKFLKAWVGYAKGGVVDLLLSDQGGVKLLCLVTALLGSQLSFSAAQVLERLLEETSEEQAQSIRPTDKQLTALLDVISPRCQGFAEQIFNYQVTLRYAESPADPSRPVDQLLPDTEGIVQLVTAFRQIGRLGLATTDHIEVDAGGCTAWVAAFTEWCLGKQPQLFLFNGHRVCGAEDSQVIIRDTGVHELRVGIYHRVKRLSDLTTTQSPPEQFPARGVQGPYHGLCSLGTYGGHFMMENELDRGDRRTAFRAALPFAVYQARGLIFSHYPQYTPSQTSGHGPERRSIDPDLLDSRFSPFRSLGAAASVMTMLFFPEKDVSKERPVEIQPMEIVPVLQTPSLSMCLQRLERECPHCQPADVMGFRRCEKERFLDALVEATATVISLSLFCNPGQLQVELHGSYVFPESKTLTTAIRGILNSGNIHMCNIKVLLGWALSLIGHHESTQPGWVMSSRGGQAVWPLVYASGVVKRTGYMSLDWASGIIHYKGTSYTKVQSQEGHNASDLQDPAPGIPVERPLNRFLGVEPEWKVTKGDGELRVMLGLAPPHDHSRIDPCNLFANLSSSLIMEECAHDPAAALERADGFCTWATPTMLTAGVVQGNHRAEFVGVVPVDDSERMRMFSMACGKPDFPMVVRQQACLACCLLVCRRAVYPVLIF